jgi:two-component system sensor histidine kinase QseC
MRSIAGRLLLVLGCGLVLLPGAGGAAVYWRARADMVRHLDDGLLARARLLAAFASVDQGRVEFEFDSGPIDVGDGPFEFRSSSGEILRRSPGLEGWTLPAPAGQMPGFGDVQLPGGRAGRAVWLTFDPRAEARDEHDDEPPGAAVSGDEGEVDEAHHPSAAAAGAVEPMIVVAAVDRGPVDAALGALAAALLGAGGVAALGMGVLVLLAVRSGLAPLRRLGAELGGVSGPTISQRFDARDAPRELEPVYRELNRMLERVESALERERAFADAAAHELRTPLAELRATAEVAARWPDLERATAALREILQIGGEMERLVESLLLLSRGQAGSPLPVGLEPVVRGCLARSAGPIGQKRLDLRVDLNAGTLRATPEAVEIIVRNLLDNAVEYTPGGGAIRVSSVPVNGSCALVVENGPVTLAERDLERLFEPFFRADRSRGDRSHAGLGLTVARRVAAVVGLGIEATLEGDRLRVRVWPVDTGAPEDPRRRPATG